MTRSRSRFLARLTSLSAAALTVAAGVVLPAGVAYAADPCGAPVTNKVACENSKPGVPESQWRVSGGDGSIVGYPSDISVNLGGSVDFKIDTNAASYRIDIYRLGWYGGDGARKIATVNPSASLPQSQPACRTDATGLYDCGSWAVSASWAVPTTAVSGLYYAVPHRNDTGGENEIFFVVRDDSSHSDLYLQASDSTWQAYNNFGGTSMYSGTGPGPAGSAWKVSYNRPLSGSGDENMPFNAEYPMIRFLESNGYDLSYGSGLDTDRYGALLRNHRAFVSVGHDEYWSGAQRGNVEAARSAGVNLAFFAGNEVFWKTRWEPSIDSSATANRTLVCYKETKWGAKIDPSPEWTGTWRDPRFSPPSDGGRPENGLLGQEFLVNGYRSDALQVPAAYGAMRLWRNTPLAGAAAGSTYSFAAGTLGYEWDAAVDNGFQPAGVAQMSRTTVDINGTYVLQNYGDQYGSGTVTHALTLYRDRASNALVFSAGTVQWAWGLDDNHAFSTGTSTVDVRIRQATVNVFADMGVQPATLQAGLVAATASTDTVAPAVTIDTPASPAVSTSVTLTGTVADTGGKVAGVEVSVDGGSSWHPATWQAGSSAWSYVFTPTAAGALTVAARAVDDSANLSAPTTTSISVSARSCPCSIWPSSTVPGTTSANDTSALELGVKFRSQQDGWITGVRFYKGTGNTGTHTGSLWTTAGKLLSTGTFSGETAAGWQTLALGQAVPVTAGTTYVASYHTSTGHYAADGGYFASTGFANQPLTALANGTDGPNGVYRAGASGFPTDTYNSANYWVDVVFATAAPPDTQPPQVASVAPAANAGGVSLTGPVSVTFNEPVTSGALQFGVGSSTGTVSGSVALNAAGTTATFTPGATLAGGTGYTATVRATDLAGNQMPAAYSWSFTTGTPRPASCPCTIWDDFVQPVNPSTNDPSAIELGTKVRFDVNGYVTGVRFYKGTSNTGPHTGSLWSATGSQLATGTFTGETGSGWQTLTFTAPVKVSANTTYVVSYHTTAGYYSSTPGYFGGTSADYQALHAPADGAVGGNGVYRYGAGGFPSSSYNAANYWVDVLWTNSLTGDNTPPSVTGSGPAAGTSGVPLTPSVTATFNEPLDPATVQFTLADGGGAKISSTVSYDSATNTATMTPVAPLAAGETYTASVSAADASGNLMTAPVTWSFTTTTSQTCPCGIFSAATVPTVQSSSDTGAYQLGVRFTSDVTGVVNGVRFYKGPNNLGTHTGSLWTANGQLLATGTFAGETATGWQTLMFASPVSIAANTPYVASYTVTAGGYAADSQYFERGEATSVPLHAPATGAGTPNGVYGLGTAFPDRTYRGANYWVDVIVAPAPAAAPVPASSPTSPTLAPQNGGSGTVLQPILPQAVTPSGSSQPQASPRRPRRRGPRDGELGDGEQEA
ncbi:MAG: DUF4082 domain-containing protein [Actinobacteria bacterium]|nr:DUF4082 domain-containing protein [Actinomycetota bacterium]MBI3686322.1 DUF4082 domain-containing protein [Actinomycetota bacterium]